MFPEPSTYIDGSQEEFVELVSWTGPDQRERAEDEAASGPASAWGESGGMNNKTIKSGSSLFRDTTQYLDCRYLDFIERRSNGRLSAPVIVTLDIAGGYPLYFPTRSVAQSITFSARASALRYSFLVTSSDVPG